MKFSDLIDFDIIFLTCKDHEFKTGGAHQPAQKPTHEERTQRQCDSLIHTKPTKQQHDYPSQHQERDRRIESSMEASQFTQLSVFFVT